MNHLGFTFFVTAFRQGNQTLSLTADCKGLGMGSFDAFVLEQLPDERTAQGNTVIFQTAQLVTSYSMSHISLTPLHLR
jgi:hypothetical protein